MAVATDFTKETEQLLAELKNGPKPLHKLPKALQEPDFLDYLLGEGRIELGRPNSAERRDFGIKEEPEVRKFVTEVSKAITWTDLGEQWHKPIWELLQEEKDMPDELKLQVRLVSRSRQRGR